MTPSGVGPGPGPRRQGSRLGGISIVFLCCSATRIAAVTGDLPRSAEPQRVRTATVHEPCRDIADEQSRQSGT